MITGPQEQHTPANNNRTRQQGELTLPDGTRIFQTRAIKCVWCLPKHGTQRCTAVSQARLKRYELTVRSLLICTFEYVSHVMSNRWLGSGSCLFRCSCGMAPLWHLEQGGCDDIGSKNFIVRLHPEKLVGGRVAKLGLADQPLWFSAGRAEVGAALALHTSFREQVLVPAIRPSNRAPLRSQAGPHAGAWLAAIPADPATTLAPGIMHIALRRRLRLPLPFTRARCAREGAPGCRALVDNLGDHALACPRTGLLARRGFVLKIQVVREAIGPEGRVVPQQWLANTTAPGVAANDRRRLDFVIYGAAAHGEALCCDAPLVSPVRRDGSPQHPQAGAPERDGVAIATVPIACVLAAEVGGRWNDESQRLVQRLVATRALRAPATLRPGSRKRRAACRGPPVRS